MPLLAMPSMPIGQVKLESCSAPMPSRRKRERKRADLLAEPIRPSHPASPRARISRQSS
jgi:hypothetical protein